MREADMVGYVVEGESSGTEPPSVTRGYIHARSACPRPDEVVSYLLGMLAKKPGRRFELHLTLCPECRLEVSALQKAMSEVEA
jgi:hypothetical protein